MNATLTVPAIRYDDAGQMHEAWIPGANPAQAGITIEAARTPAGLTVPALTLEVFTTAGYTHVRITPAQARRLAVAIIEAAATLDLSNDWPSHQRHDIARR